MRLINYAMHAYLCLCSLFVEGKTSIDFGRDPPRDDLEDLLAEFYELYARIDCTTEHDRYSKEDIDIPGDLPQR